MWNSRTARFRSSNYPKTGQPFMVIQETAMKYYGIFILAAMTAVMIKLYNRQDVLLVGMIGSVLAVVLANFSAYVVLHKRNAEIFFVNDNFSLISVYDILYEVPHKAFPLKFANPTRTEDEIQIHFVDQIMTLKREDWEEFDLFWNWLNQSHMDFTSTTS